MNVAVVRDRCRVGWEHTCKFVARIGPGLVRIHKFVLSGPGFQ